MASNGQYYHQFYALFHPQWYEDLTHYEPGDDLLALVSPLLPPDWTIARSGNWFIASSSRTIILKQGWKIHISATWQNCREILSKAAAICLQEETSFKFALDQFLVTFSTSKLISRGSSGKFITIYPANDDSFHKLLRLLYQALKDFTGPYILSDRRYKDAHVIYYRYGGIQGLNRLTPSGSKEYLLISPSGEEVLDERTPYWNPPAWVTDPFEEAEEATEEVEEELMTLKDGRYEIESVFRFTVAGGVYFATDLHTGQHVVIKEARRAVGVDKQGRDAIDYLQKEYRLLQKLQGTEVTARPIDLFWEWEHLFLVEEYLEGPDLGKFTIASHPFAKVQPVEEEIVAYVKKLLAIWLHIAQGLGRLHELGVVHGDISIKNIIISDEEKGDIHFIDLEAAWEIGQDDPIAITTPGFAHKAGETGQKEGDIYGFGAVMLATLFPLNSFFDVEPEARSHIVKQLGGFLGMAPEAQQLIESCMNSDPDRLPALPPVIQIIKQLPIKQPAMSASPALDQQALLNIINNIISYIDASKDLSRQDRLFPADPRVFGTNPLSIAYGANGIAYALAHLHAPISSKVRAWILKQASKQERFPPGLYTGSAGIAWTFWDMGLEEMSLHILRSARNHPLLKNAADIFSGTAGYGLACLRLYLNTDEQEWLDQAVLVGERLLETKRHEIERGYYWQDRDGQTSLSYAYGSSGIALYLLYLSQFTGDKRFLAAGQLALAFDLSYLRPMEEGHLSVPRGNVEQFEQVVTHYWLNGSAGILTTLLRYWYVTHEPTYLHLIDRLSQDTMRQLTIFPSLFLGQAGLGNVLLDVYDFLGDEHYLQQAQRAAQGILLYKITRPEGMAFPGEQLLRISTDFGTGSAGIALFLQRLAYAKQHPGNFNFLLDQSLH